MPGNSHTSCFCPIGATRQRAKASDRGRKERHNTKDGADFLGEMKKTQKLVYRMSQRDVGASKCEGGALTDLGKVLIIYTKKIDYFISSVV